MRKKKPTKKNSSRRRIYSRVKRFNEVKSEHSTGMGDIVFKGFQCLNPHCKNMIFVKESEIGNEFDIECEVCNYHISDGCYTEIYDYDLYVDGEVKGSGVFDVSHDEYIKNSERYKYCIICKTIKPLHHFGNHNGASRKSKKQGECRMCKDTYNSIKNGTRLSDQHREAGEKRRLLVDISGEEKIDSEFIYKKYNYKCFSCGKDLMYVKNEKERPLDHTLPLYYLWPLKNDSATLLCDDCNGGKSGKWPSEYYNEAKLRELSIKTGIDYNLISGEAKYNPDAIKKLEQKGVVDELLVKYAKYMEKAIIPLRNRIMKDLEFDMFGYSKDISDEWIKIANSKL